MRRFRRRRLWKMIHKPTPTAYVANRYGQIIHSEAQARQSMTSMRLLYLHESRNRHTHLERGPNPRYHGMPGCHLHLGIQPMEENT